MNWYKKAQQDNNSIEKFIKSFPYERAGKIEPASGEGGEGVYAYPSQNRSMKEYYSKKGEDIHLIRPHPDTIILDLTTKSARDNIIAIGKKNGYRTNVSNYHKELWAIKEYLYNKNYDAYLLPHKGYDIPSGTQLIITNINKFDIISKNDILFSQKELTDTNELV